MSKKILIEYIQFILDYGYDDEDMIKVKKIINTMTMSAHGEMLCGLLKSRLNKKMEVDK